MTFAGKKEIKKKTKIKVREEIVIHYSSKQTNNEEKHSLLNEALIIHLIDDLVVDETPTPTSRTTAPTPTSSSRFQHCASA